MIQLTYKGVEITKLTCELMYVYLRQILTLEVSCHLLNTELTYNVLYTGMSYLCTKLLVDFLKLRQLTDRTALTLLLLGKVNPVK